jgi:hypothetical protein
MKKSKGKERENKTNGKWKSKSLFQNHISNTSQVKQIRFESH